MRSMLGAAKSARGSSLANLAGMREHARHSASSLLNTKTMFAVHGIAALLGLVEARPARAGARGAAVVQRRVPRSLLASMLTGAKA